MKENVLLNKKNILILTLILAFLLTISSVSAVDDVTDDSVRIENQNDDLISESNDDVLNLAPKSFTDLNKAINGNTNKDIYLEYNYTFDSNTDSNFKEGININRAVTIHGNGYTIDGDSNARIFMILGGDVVL